MGIEPTFEAWEAPVLPLNYTRITGTGDYITALLSCLGLFQGLGLPRVGQAGLWPVQACVEALFKLQYPSRDTGQPPCVCLFG